MLLRRRSVLRGVVQGVGFRPHVARVASRYAVAGFCGNDDESVFIEAEGDAEEVAAFLSAVRAELPPLASIVSVQETDLGPTGEHDGFRIVESRHTPGALTLVPPDMARCDDCLRELHDPGDRRYRHPFISCTNCGPRFSIIRDVPYDRSRTTLADFPMCEACRAEYENPLDRRFHAEPISCFDCGPRLWLEDATGEIAQWHDAVARARAIIADGGVVGVKGMGGVTLFCDARNPEAVARLRERKHRPGKPLAVMAASLDTAAAVARFSAEQALELRGQQRPIVLAAKSEGYDLAELVAPGLDEIGVMLPSAPLHDLLLREGEIRVATSGNRSGEPLCYRNEPARRDLTGIVDALLLNDRDIHVPVEDSVLMADGDTVVPIRRSRGFAPLPIALPVREGRQEPTVLGVGAELKNTFTVTRDGLAFVSAHIGDMGALATQRAFERSVDQLLTAHRTRPAVIVADRHPGYSTAAWAQRAADADGTALLRVQHHHAHALSLAAEHGMLERQLLCAVFDGTGYGDDGAVWGGELLRVRGLEAERVWHLREFGLAGGDSAVQKPWKAAVALLAEHGIDDEGMPPLKAADPVELGLLRQQLAGGFGVVRCSSAGRLFDAVASLLGLRHRVSYEAQAAMELEACARRCTHPEHAHPEQVGSEAASMTELLETIVRGVRDAVEPACLARSFHAGVADLTAAAIAEALTPDDTIGLSGGVFQNRMLVHDLRARLARLAPGSPVLTHRIVPANDGGLSLGQAAAGHLHLMMEGAQPCA